jgi:hypothetical protein
MDYAVNIFESLLNRTGPFQPANQELGSGIQIGRVVLAAPVNLRYQRVDNSYIVPSLNEMVGNV